MSVCPWEIAETCLSDTWDDYDEEVQDYAVALASGSLHALSGYRVGGCPITVRPSNNSGGCPSYGLYGPLGPLFRYGWTEALWVPAGGSDPLSGCSVDLPGPVGQLISVKVDGDEQELSDYRVDGTLLVYQGDDDCPLNGDQDLRLLDTEVGTWSVTYLNSIVPDHLAQVACFKLALEFAKACEGDKNCRLPSNVSSITRTGVTMEFNAGLWPDGFTGIHEVDAWLSIVNPRQRKGQTKIYSSDTPEPRIQGAT